MPRRKLIPHKMPVYDDRDRDPSPVREICLGESKSIFETEAAAALEAERLGREKGVELGTYQCVHCLGWHLTRKRDGKRRR